MSTDVNWLPTCSLGNQRAFDRVLFCEGVRPFTVIEDIFVCGLQIAQGLCFAKFIATLTRHEAILTALICGKILGGVLASKSVGSI